MLELKEIKKKSTEEDYNWSTIKDYYIGQIGIHPKDFWINTFQENYLISESFHIKNNLQWEQTRYIACMIYNMNISKKSQAKKPKDLFQLPQDKINVYRPPKSTKEEFEKMKADIEWLQENNKFKELK